MSRAVRFLGAWCAALAALVTIGAPPAGAALGDGQWSPPVSGPVVRGFEPPETPFGPGHLGVDFAVASGTPVRAAGDGVVVFAGRVGSALHVVTKHAGDIRTGDSFLASIAVVTGQAVRRGEEVGTSGGTGPGHGAGVLHFGVRVGDRYVDPMLLFAPPDLAAVVHLARPRHGTSGAPVGPGAGDERAALAAEMRVDGRTAAAPPPWWNDPPDARPAAPAIPRADVVRPVTASPRAAPLGVAPAAVGSVVVGAAVGGVFLRGRRRRGPR